ncbi:MAG: GDYXXLXY domain-containing protein [Lentisphaerae bacterium]|jgi:uncharacterized membrane-anchored protein|nr:GDYXXLXY domain-containing protein [Lentisphaerota bacterium]
MNRRRMLTIALIGLVAQFGVMGFMIMQREIALRNGVECRFLTAPVDPYDAFRGRYVSLNLTENNRMLCDREYARGQRIYVIIGNGTNGYSRIERLAPRPGPDDIYIRTRVAYCWPEYREIPAITNNTALARRSHGRRHVLTGKYQVHAKLPLDRYYMEEKLAPEAERAYQNASRRDSQPGVLVVRVWRGMAVIEDLELGGRPIRDVARERLER